MMPPTATEDEVITPVELRMTEAVSGAMFKEL